MNELKTLSDSELIVEESSGINVELLLKVASVIEKEFMQFDMEHWCSTRKLPNPWWRAMWGLPAETEACATTLCIAGWTVKLGGGDLTSNIPAQAQRLLNLNLKQAQKLFYMQDWPSRFRYAKGTPKTDASWRASERIRHFIATDGRE